MPAFFALMTRLALVIGLLLPLRGLAADEGVTRFCVFDPLGEQGDIYAMVHDYVKEASAWGANLEPHVYTDETIAVEDFKTHQCDIINLTGLRARQFNSFTGTIDSPGAVETYAQMSDLLSILVSPSVERYMVNGQYEVAGIMPLGAGYPFVADKKINTLAKVAGKKIAVMDWDTTQTVLVQQLGAQPVLSDITNYGAKFNNGSVDVIIAPILFYRPFELYRGLGTKGGIVRHPVIQLTMQLLIRHDRFPPGFGEHSREYVAGQKKHAFSLIKTLEGQVNEHNWMYISTEERSAYYKMMRDARIQLATQGYYDKRMLNILKRVRCKANPTDGECAESLE